MVQRKLPSKLGIQDNRIKSEIRLSNLKPSSLKYQDIKNKGVDLKKKMKKSGSIERIEFENHRTPKLPNYMKSTSSSVARKEQSQVSARSLPTSHVSSDLHGKNLNCPSKLSADSRKKAAKTSVRKTSLKMKRTLIKTPSFKQGRALVKKCPKVVLYEDFDIARATCSSTLKDYNLPDYLVLNPRGTESEGTSVVKVCPYTHCSLNGHLHYPLPPLKSFMSAKRLVLKNQRNVQLGCLSTRRARPAGDDIKSGEKLVCPLTLEEPSEFFVEIYGAGEKNTSNTDFEPMVGGRDEIIVQDYGEVDETISDGDDIDFHETVDEDRDETDSIDMYLEAKLLDEISLPSLFQEEKKLGNLSIWSDVAAESISSIQQYEQDSESSDMNWETGRYSALYLDFDYELPSNEEKRGGLDGFQDDNGMIPDGFIKESHDCVTSFLDSNDMSEDTYSEESLNSDSASSKDDCRSEVSFHYLDSLNSIETSSAIEFPKEEPEDEYKDLSFEGNKTPEKITQVGATEAASELMVEEETSFGCLNFGCLPNDDAVAVTDKGQADLLKDVVLEMVISGDKANGDTIIDVDVSVRTSSDEGPGIPVEENIGSLSHTEAVAIIVRLTKEDSSESPTKPDQVAAPNKVGREILKHSLLLEDPFTGEGIAIAIAKCKRSMEGSDEGGQFNPREPNFLPLEPEAEAEKVDLRHQELDEKKNAEEWMVDYALRQTVTKLGPARKKKVALLVEAFEKVMPITKCELYRSHSSAFDHARPVQACN